ncbi:uncharacterized protein BYT42DRAFT_573461 [Radiomyces spectabilis]|uniref:uncharacterized protein n=1 Tax=Radiomyces spectabilis TaxID=64574 RepID=UPI00221EF1CD|nr:uncharacterized protein BYT42DRAFT_573461 [Radiomyces spectabilis]KAI8376114.1 hypothetical protein BYT42DRAFT_573461 [Radiomyces spectabilis]
MNKQLLSTIARARFTSPSTAVVGRRSMSAYSHMSDNDPVVLEREKRKQQNVSQREWNEKLASQSEAAVKADQQEDEDLQSLQQKSAEHLKNQQD